MILIECEQYSPEYWQARRGVPTASHGKDLLTPERLQPSKSQDTYINQLIAEVFDDKYPRTDEFATSAMKNGTIMEPECRNFYEWDTGCKVTQVGFCLTDDRRYGCSPDGFVGDDGGLEIKSPHPKTHVGYLRDKRVPPEYLLQIHWSLLVTGRKWWDFVSYCPGTALPPLRIRVEPDAITRVMEGALNDFCDKYQKALTAITNEVPVEALVPSVPEYGELSSDYWA